MECNCSSTRIKSLRRRQGYTIEKLAERAGITKVSLRNRSRKERIFLKSVVQAGKSIKCKLRFYIGRERMGDFRLYY